MASKATASDIVNALNGKTEGLTATAIAHALGFSKASAIKDVITEAVSAGSIVVDCSGRYEVYKVAAKKAVAKAEPKKEAVTLIDAEKVATKLPEATSSDLHGYRVDSVKVDGKAMKRVTTPEGKKIRMENDEKLLVVNNEPKFMVKTAEDVITCLRKYAIDNNFTVFTIDDIKQNRKISNDKDVVIKDDHIIFMSIKKHNKAATKVAKYSFYSIL